MKSVSAEDIQEKLAGFDNEQIDIIKWLISKVVDEGLYNILFMLEDHEDLKLSVPETDIKEESDGLPGELYTEDGWIPRYSDEL